MNNNNDSQNSNQSSILGIPVGETPTNNSNNSLLGINTNSQDNFQSPIFSTNNPALEQALNNLEAAIKSGKNDKGTIDALAAVLGMTTFQQISQMRPTLTPSALDTIPKASNSADSNNVGANSANQQPQKFDEQKLNFDKKITNNQTSPSQQSLSVEERKDFANFLGTRETSQEIATKNQQSDEQSISSQNSGWASRFSGGKGPKI